MSVRYRYNRQLTPPAPCVYVSLARPDNISLSVRNVPAQLDTAAYMTVVPMSVIDQLQLVQIDQASVAGFGGLVSVVPVFLVRIGIDDYRAETVQVLANRDEPIVLLGRDILNRHRVVLDGPRLVVDIDAP
jgi:predicted aspartyl protease